MVREVVKGVLEPFYTGENLRVEDMYPAHMPHTSAHSYAPGDARLPSLITR